MMARDKKTDSPVAPGSAGSGAGIVDLSSAIDWSHVVPSGDAALTKIDPASGKPVTLLGDPANDLTKSILDRLILDETEPYIVISANGHILAASSTYEELAVRSAGGLPLATGNHDAKVTSEIANTLAEVRLARQPIEYQQRLTIEGADRFYATKFLPVCNESGEVAAVVVHFRDITAQHVQLKAVNEAQQRFKDFARATSDWFWEVDRELRVTVLTERFTALTGVPSAVLIGRDIKDVGVFKPNIEGISSIGDAIVRRVSFRDQLFEVNKGDQETVKFHLSGVPVFDRVTGEFCGFRGAGMDVTEHYAQLIENRIAHDNLEQTLDKLVLRNKQLDIATLQAESALRAKNEFLAAMSHELRTPLNAIIGFSEAMKMEVYGELNEQYKGYSSDIHSAGRHLLGLIEDVLDVAIIESGEINLSPTLVSLQEVLEQAAALCGQRAEAAKIDLSGLEVHEDHDLYADARRAVQIFVNLLTNAVKFTPEGGKIGYEVATRSDGMIAVTVWDDGIGIHQDHQEVIFEKFRQLEENVYARRTEGTGLGLHISRELARRMGGDILLESEEQKGSRFTVLLPLASG